MILEILWCLIFTPLVILLSRVKTQGKNMTSLKKIFLMSKSHCPKPLAIP